MEIRNKKKHHLENVIKDKAIPIIKDKTSTILGLDINKLNNDISSILEKGPIMDFEIDTNLKFKEAKKKFKRAYLKRVLMLNLGNISETAKVAESDRRSIHRLIKNLKIDLKKIKKELAKPYEIKKTSMNYAIEKILDNYKEIIHPKK